jgi:hypothetical protein
MIASIASIAIGDGINCTIAIGPSLPVVACRNWPSSETCFVFASRAFNSLMN